MDLSHRGTSKFHIMSSISFRYYELCVVIGSVLFIFVSNPDCHSRSRQSVTQNYWRWKNPLSLFLSIQVEVTTTGAAHCLPILRPYGPVVPAGTAWEDAALAPPRLPPVVQASPPHLQGPSMAMAWEALAEWLAEVFVSGVPVPLHPRTATSTMSTQMRRSLSSLLLLLLHALFTFPILCSRATLYPGGTAELCH